MTLAAQIGAIVVPQEFTRLCNALLIAEFGDEFLQIDDDRGDRGNDGYVRRDQRMFAMHCFKRLQNQGIEREIHRKITSDLGKAIALKEGGFWDIRRWTFLANYPIPEVIAAAVTDYGSRHGVDVSWRGPDYLASLLAQHRHVLELFPALEAPALDRRLAQIGEQVAALGETSAAPPCESARLVRERPPAWEYSLLVEELRRRRDELDPKWRDFSLGLRSVRGPRLTREEATGYLQNLLVVPSAAVHNIDQVFTVDYQEAAFGVPGESGDPNAICHLAERVMEGYEALLDYAIEVRSASVPEAFERYFVLCAEMVSAPIMRIRAFVDQLADQVDYAREFLELPEAAKSARGPVTLTVDLDVALTEGVVKEIEQEGKRLRRRLRWERWS